MKHIKYDPDTYLLYGVSKPPYPSYPVRLRVTMRDDVKGEVLNGAVQRAIRRYPYFAVKVTVDADGGYLLQPNSEPVSVAPTQAKTKTLGSEAVNRHLLSVDYEGRDIYFNIHHTLTGGIGLVELIKTALYEYVTEAFGVSLPADDIRMADSALIEGETDYPDINRLSRLYSPESYRGGDGYSMNADYMEAYMNPQSAGDFYFTIDMPKTSLMDYCKRVGGSPTSVLTVLMTKTMYQVLPEDADGVVAGIVHNFRDEVGCPVTYRDMVRNIYVPIGRQQSSLTAPELNALTREKIRQQVAPEYGLAELQRITDDYLQTDSLSTLAEKCQYNLQHSRYVSCPRATFNISYFGQQLSWGALSAYISTVHAISEGHLMLEMIPVGDKFCISFYQVISNRKYIDAFTNLLTQEGIACEVSGSFMKNLPGVELPVK